MNSTELDKENESIRVDFRYFIQSAVQKNLPWHTLAIYLTDLAPTLEKSRQVIMILVQELEKWVVSPEVLKFEDESKRFVNVSDNHDPFEPNQDGNDDQIVNETEKV